MSVRHLGGALRWVVIESLEERLGAMQERLQGWGVTAVMLGTDTASSDLQQCREVGLKRDINLAAEYAAAQKEEKQPFVPTEDRSGSQEPLLRRQLRVLEQLSALILEQIAKCRGAGEETRLGGLEEELREAVELRSSATNCLQACLTEEGRTSSEVNTLSSDCTSESSNLASVYRAVSSTSNDHNEVKGNVPSNECRAASAFFAPSRNGELFHRRSASALETDPQFTSVSMEGWMDRKSSSPRAGTTNKKRPASSSTPRRPQKNTERFYVYGVAMVPERPKTKRPATAKASRRDCMCGGDHDSITSHCGDLEPKEMKEFNLTDKEVEVVDAAGVGVSVVVRRMLRPSRQQTQSKCRVSPDSMNKIRMTYRPALTVRRDVRKSRLQEIVPGLRESTEAAAVAVDAARAAVAASSSSAPHTPCASAVQGSGKQQSSSIGHLHQGSEEWKKQGRKRSGYTTRRSRSFNPDSEFIQVCRERGNRCMRNKQYEAAVKAYSEAIERDPENDIILCNRAAAYFLLNQYVLTLMDCESVLSRSPSNLKAHWRAAKALLYTNNVQAARRHYRVAREMCVNLVEERAIAEEMKALRAYEMYYVYMKECRWIDSVECADQLLRAFGSTGVVGLPWQCRKLEALLNLDSWRTLEDIKRLRKAYPKYAELLFLHAKCLFYCVHDPNSTGEILELVQAACRQKEIEGCSQDSRYTHLERTVVSFEHHRDRGNTAYESGDWMEAYTAYTRCLTLDPLNKSLIAVTYCNRAAASMQCGRWNDALSDVHRSIQINGNNAKVYARRARIYLHFMRDKARVGIDYLQFAINDLRRAVELAPTDENRQQLAEAMKLKEREERSKDSRSSDGNEDTDRGRNPNETPRFCSNDANSASGGPRQKTYGHSGDAPNIFASENSKAHCTKVLGLENTAGLDARSLTRAYREAALRWHPDRWIGSGPGEHEAAEQKFKEIHTAYQTLKETMVR
ncbi:putative TPR-repeat-containing chaperone protein DNAJ [Trypanosoma cruzi]|uniref:TPR-repeat-containing chaperone protein DnaJ, putative n=2 Tax=Trypanosoma cruzi TaxID=5693 RepID=Q4DF91_TRYCC|nr:TPR-repeat-containing chaperone protein DnaJ, putative [Trypanosoma cruzi]EAN91187.1 TPR-repeat-containing chaperone protein DnaJ, putative [Trypanosoma cruzi]PWV20158.1 putative TPR-repeat-containing chaperone protein DNAJ [Trypanosoma cruzi]RNC41926.1 putative TPR-repeat-containing chaperone protein DNAJ [Trypanosoma cruzi]|eukprot:XP_813038.1 TPR-repeat-containing chaperone protein DnaJ [Trypanosoma cruzi strain CL Brener]